MQSTIHKSLEITIMQSNVTSLPGSLYVCFALCNCSRTHTDVLTWCYIVGYSTYTITAHRVCVLRTLVVELIAVVSNDLLAPCNDMQPLHKPDQEASAISKLNCLWRYDTVIHPSGTCKSDSLPPKINNKTRIDASTSNALIVVAMPRSVYCTPILDRWAPGEQSVY